jgi:Na+-translocating ferredoxin:NAD+ oxidoreductase RnfE subunit
MWGWHNRPVVAAEPRDSAHPTKNNNNKKILCTPLLSISNRSCTSSALGMLTERILAANNIILLRRKAFNNIHIKIYMPLKLKVK